VPSLTPCVKVLGSLSLAYNIVYPNILATSTTKIYKENHNKPEPNKLQTKKNMQTNARTRQNRKNKLLKVVTPTNTKNNTIQALTP